MIIKLQTHCLQYFNNQLSQEDLFMNTRPGIITKLILFILIFFRLGSSFGYIATLEIPVISNLSFLEKSRIFL